MIATTQENKLDRTPLDVLAVITLACASLFPIWAAYRQHNCLNDDTYITLTYVRNLVANNGFVYNFPPSTLGTTTPLFTMVIAGIAAIVPRVDIPLLAVLFTAFCWIGIVWSFWLFRQSWHITAWQVVIIGLVVIASGWTSNLGMEAYLFALLIVLSFSLLFSKRYALAGVATGLLFLTRGEGALVLCVLLAASLIPKHDLSTNRSLVWSIRPFLSILIGFCLLVVPWLAYAYVTFGHVLPNTLAAKQAQLQSGTGRFFIQRLAEEWLPSWGAQFTIKYIPILNFWWLSLLAGLVYASFQNRRWLVWLAWIILYICGYTILGVSAYWWYQLPILFVLHIFVALGLIEVIIILRSRLGSEQGLFGATSPLAAPFRQFQKKYEENRRLGLQLAIVLIAVFVYFLGRPTFDFTLAYQGDARCKSYLGLAEWIRGNTQPAESVAYMEIGYLGYYTNNRIIDLAGLATPDIVPHIAKHDFSWGFWQYMPDYYVYLPDFDWALASIKADPRFDQSYRPIATLPGPGQASFTIYRRISLAAVDFDGSRP